LFRREAAREADGQPVGVEPGQPGEPRLERRVHVPERVRVELVDGLPTAFVGRSLGPHPDGAEQIVELGCEPGAEVDAVRDVPDLRLLARPERRPHLACDFTVQLGDGVGGGREPERERRQPEAVRPRGAAELEERVARQTRAAGEVARVAEDELVVEHLVARRHRRVRGEDRRPADALQRALGLLSGLDEPPGPLDREEGRVALVDVEDGRRKAERREGAYAADAEEKLLADPVLAVSAVQRVGQQLDVQQVEGHRADVVAPDGGGDGLVRQLDLDGDRLAHETGGLRVNRLVVLRLPARIAQALREVPVAVEEPDADEGEPEVGCGFQMVAGEHPEAAGVDRQARVDGELHAEVRDEEVAVGVRLHAPPPGVVVCGVEGGQRRIESRGRAAAQASERAAIRSAPGSLFARSTWPRSGCVRSRSHRSSRAFGSERARGNRGRAPSEVCNSTIHLCSTPVGCASLARHGRRAHYSSRDLGPGAPLPAGARPARCERRLTACDHLSGGRGRAAASAA